MNTNPDSLDALFSAARTRRADTSRAEYGFESRLLARLHESKGEAAPVWSAVSWRMASIFAVAVLALTFLEVHVESIDQATEQDAYAQNPEAVDLLSSL